MITKILEVELYKEAKKKTLKYYWEIGGENITP